MTGARASEQSEQPKSKEFARSKKQFVTKSSEDPHLAGVTASIIIKSVTASNFISTVGSFYLFPA